MRAQFIFTEAMTGLRRNVTMTAASAVVITLTLTLLGVAFMVRTATHKTEAGFLNQLNVSVYFEKACGTENAGTICATPADITNVQRTLQGLPQVKSIQFIDSQQAIAIFRREFANNPDLIKTTPVNALPESFLVKLHNPHDYSLVKSAVGVAPGVADVNDASAVLKKLFQVFDRLSQVVLGFAALLVIATVLLIYNAMRLAAFTRRREVGIMRLVGASDFFIQGPFVLEGTIIGVLSGLLATLALVVTRVVLHDVLNIALLHQLGTWATVASVLPWVWLLAIVLPAVASYATLQRHLRV